jgi:hypothetical protein
LQDELLEKARKLVPEGEANAAVLVIGHQPAIGWLAEALLGWPVPAAQSEILCIDLEANALKWCISPADDSALQALQDKIKSKMALANLLSGFITAGLSVLLAMLADQDKRDDLGVQAPVAFFAIACLLIEATGIAPTNDFESAIDARLVPGAYTAIVRGNGNTSGVGLVEVYDLSPAAASKLGNISTRAFVSTGDDIVIAGFILGGSSNNDRVAVRGIGPSLTAAGVPNALANPTLELRDSNGALLVANNDWQDDPAQTAELSAAGRGRVP